MPPHYAPLICTALCGCLLLSARRLCIYGKLHFSHSIAQRQTDVMRGAYSPTLYSTRYGTHLHCDCTRAPPPPHRVALRSRQHNPKMLMHRNFICSSARRRCGDARSIKITSKHFKLHTQIYTHPPAYRARRALIFYFSDSARALTNLYNTLHIKNIILVYIIYDETLKGGGLFFLLFSFFIVQMFLIVFASVHH